MVDGLGLVLAWGGATTWPAVAVYYFPTLAIPIATVTSVILIPLSVWELLVLDTPDGPALHNQ
ncbi:MAG: hypothetical protein R3C56_41190 [Pirellulaceae bacterium]